jgi:predicted SAM-dependent methyltransferase
VKWDLTHPLPIEDASCRLIYSEHVLEHFPVELGQQLLCDCYRVLTRGGILRIAMPSLDHITRKYLSTDWQDQEWLKRPEHRFIQTPAEMLNIALRYWGHEWLYDEKELRRRLHSAGFVNVRTVDYKASEVPELRDRETRGDSLLIAEALR